ncbi:MAG: hypothetical protein HQK50_00130 [Oligoflexia bacterium]|nr:hypothetical protein [Oligoflexia bacterium]MBF0363941.1 hypothetical protein [Oligoflexia bacterium]
MYRLTTILLLTLFFSALSNTVMALPKLLIKMHRDADNKTVYLVGDLHNEELDTCEYYNPKKENFYQLLNTLKNKSNEKTMVITEMSERRHEMWSQNPALMPDLFLPRAALHIKDTIEKEKIANFTYCTGDDVRFGNDIMGDLCLQLRNVKQSDLEQGFIPGSRLTSIADQLCNPEKRCQLITHFTFLNSQLNSEGTILREDKEPLYQYIQDYLYKSNQFVSWLNLFASNETDAPQKVISTLPRNQAFAILYPPNLEAVTNIVKTDANNYVLYYGMQHIEDTDGDENTSQIPSIQQMLTKLGFVMVASPSRASDVDFSIFQ